VRTKDNRWKGDESLKIRGRQQEGGRIIDGKVTRVER
jgi:hypothetical protein